MSTAIQVLTDAFLKAGIIASGDVLTAEEANDGLRVFNDLLENLSLESQSVYGRSTETFLTVGGQGVYTIGPGGNWNTVRPVRIGSPGYCRYQSVDFPITPIDRADYDALAIKNQPGDIAERFLFLNDVPLGTITLWPVPQYVTSIGLHMDRLLSSISNLTTVLSFPPGYELMIKCLIAEMLAPEYGVQLPPPIAQQAARFKADVKRSNRRSRSVRFDDIPGV